MLVLTERMSHVNSLSMGVWLASGARDETAERNGISHFVEHMVFKGTTSRSAQQIAREVDSMGGNLDAFTSKENVCFNIKVLEENVAEPALDVLSDLVLHPTFTPKTSTREQGVILEEIKMDEDNPDYLVNEIFTQKILEGRPPRPPHPRHRRDRLQLSIRRSSSTSTPAASPPRPWSSPPPATSSTMTSWPRWNAASALSDPARGAPDHR